ncbi:T9SS type A sorting domain-containing protein [Hymenobacter gummosus]|uniref:T9SS type A sorting domain-containing protein n=1 Tax=Hymenobacter gummosus TaxID=1776032 RepID=A0A431TUH4_9BACT|nr:S8 family serine peptidase [Hymenobacter gummosus]RTQ44859.1 T9SS type A sorting domain-containing protein [Hymenobacter gummosus]
MNPFLRLLLAATLLLGSRVAALAQAPTVTALLPSPTLPGAAVLKLRAGARLAQAEAALQQLGATHLEQKYPRALPPSPEVPGSVELRGIYQFSYPAHLALSKVRQALLATGAVQYVEPLYQRAPLHQPNDPLADSTITNQAATQYYLKTIQAYRGWDLTRGDSTVVIGITDTGTRFTHQDLRQQIKLNYADPIDGVDNDGDGFVDNFRGWDTADRDNNPSVGPPYGGHGVLVTGCAIARAGNGKGLAGVGYNCRYLPLKIYPSTATGAFGGYEAVVYAADHGCKIINLSWGGTGGKSQYEQDVINYAALNRDAVVVVAAGNANAELDFYPASYDNVISVAGVSPSDRQVLTYSYRVTLSAPGDLILTTSADHDSAYAAVGGSSFACPITAGAAALVRSKYPQLTAAQVAAVLRRTTDDIYGVPGNTTLVGKLGSGRLNVRRALNLGPNQTAVRIRSQRLSRPRLLPADTARLTLTVENLLLPAAGLGLTVTSLTPELTVTSGPATIGALATGATAAVPVQLRVAAGTPVNTRAVLRCRFTATGGYQDDQYVVLELNPDYVVLTANDLHLTVLSRGNLGYDATNNEIGASITYRNSPVLLSEGGLMLATGPTRVMDHLRSAPLYTTDNDFFTRQAIRMQPLAAAGQQAGGIFQDSLPSLSRGRTLGVRVRQRALAYSTPADRDYAIVEYTVRNASADTLRALRAGLFMDWDLPVESGRNMADWDSTRLLGYVADRPRQATLYAGVRLLLPGARAAASYYAINNVDQANAPIYFGNGFSSAEKFLTLSSGTRQRSTGTVSGTDASHVVGALLGRLAPGDSTVVTFAVLAAPTLSQLQAAADAAQVRYLQVLSTRPAARPPLDWQVYPNPSRGVLHVQLPSAAATGSALTLLNALGQPVARWRVTQARSSLDVQQLPAGVYLLRWQNAQGETSTRRVLLQP